MRFIDVYEIIKETIQKLGDNQEGMALLIMYTMFSRSEFTNSLKTKSGKRLDGYLMINLPTVHQIKKGAIHQGRLSETNFINTTLLDIWNMDDREIMMNLRGNLIFQTTLAYYFYAAKGFKNVPPILDSIVGIAEKFPTCGYIPPEKQVSDAQYFIGRFMKNKHFEEEI